MSFYFKTFFVLLVAFLISSADPTNFVIASSEDDMRADIDNKNKILTELNQEIRITQTELTETKVKSTNIKTEVNRLDKNIKQLDLGIRTAEVSIEKLSLEINSLDQNIDILEKDITDKSISITNVIQEIQIKDSDSPLLIFLKSHNLSDGVADVQTLLDLNNQLTVKSKVLKDLFDDLKSKRTDRSSKKIETVLENKNLKYRKDITEDTKEEREYLLSLTEAEAAEHTKKLNELEQQREEIAAEVQKIESRLKDALDPNSLPLGAILGVPIRDTSAFSMITQKYGRTYFARTAYKSGFHNGVDFGIPSGTPLFASEEGEIVAVGNQDNFCYRGAYGKFIVVRHQNNLTTLYAHLSQQVVSPGQHVSRGQLIAYSGSTGFSTGPHLHYTVYASPTFYMGPSVYCGPMPFGAHLDPMDYLQE